jgi:hypothetical protein
MKDMLRRLNLAAFNRDVFPDSLLGVSAGNFQRALVN